MSELHNKVHTLKLKKALILSDIETLSEVEETVFLQLGRVVAEISKLEKLIVRQTENLTS